MRKILPLLILLFVAGCSKAPSPPTLTPVAVDEAAAYPKQAPGTKPPVLTGTLSLTKEQLDEGWLQLFDGVSTYGWEGRPENSSTLDIAKNPEGKNLILFRLNDNGSFQFSNRFGFYRINIEREAPGKLKSNGESDTTDFVLNRSTGSQGSDFVILFAQALPKNPQPLLEADWKPAAGDSKAVWTDGVLELTGGKGMIETVKEYGDFVLQLEYYTEAGVNSGVFFRCIPGEVMEGYECQIFNNPPAEDYEKFIGTDTGGIFRRCVGRNMGPKDGQWNYLTIAARGPMIATWVNGIQTADWTDTRKEDENPRKGLRLKPGTIQFQGHDPGTKIQFRNIRIAEIKDAPRQ